MNTLRLQFLMHVKNYFSKGVTNRSCFFVFMKEIKVKMALKYDKAEQYLVCKFNLENFKRYIICNI